MKFNGVLRLLSGKMPAWLFNHLKGNKYVNCLMALASFIIKMASVCVIPRVILVLSMHMENTESLLVA